MSPAPRRPRTPENKPFELDGDVTVVLVKFNFTNPALIPKGIIEVDRAPDYRMDVLHQVEAFRDGRRELGQVGRLREGRVDTGELVIETKRPTQVNLLRRGLANNEFRLTALHRFKRIRIGENWDGHTYVVCASFARVEKGIELTRSITDSLRELAGMPWQQSFVYDNPNGVVTINMSGAAKGQTPKLALVVHDHHIEVVDADLIGEEEEDAESSGDEQ